MASPCNASWPCQNLAPCSNGFCSCATGYYGSWCEIRWSDHNYVAWSACQWTLVVLCCLNTVMALAMFAAHWWPRGTTAVPFPRVTKAMWAQLMLALSSFFSILLYAIDPYRFNASAGNYLTSGYRAGLTVITNLTIAFIMIAYLFVAADWISVRAKQKNNTNPFNWNKPAMVFFFVTSAACLVFAFVAAALWVPLNSSTADLIFYVMVLVAMVFITVVVYTAAVLTLRDLSRFETKNEGVTKTITWHVILLVSFFVVTIVIIIAGNFVSVNTSFNLFVYFRFLVGGLFIISTRVTLGIHYRRKNMFDRGTAAGSSTTESVGEERDSERASAQGQVSGKWSSAGGGGDSSQVVSDNLVDL